MAVLNCPKPPGPRTHTPPQGEQGFCGNPLQVDPSLSRPPAPVQLCFPAPSSLPRLQDSRLSLQMVGGFLRKLLGRSPRLVQEEGAL